MEKGALFKCLLFVTFVPLRTEAGSCYTYVTRYWLSCTNNWMGYGCKKRTYSTKICCTNYSGATCSEPKCRYGYGSHTCNVNIEGYVKHKNGNVVRNSGGICYEPSKCRNCNKGYYPVTTSGGYCKACYRPTNCNLPVCSSWSNYWCEYCEGEYIRNKPGYNVYSGLPDSKRCQRACSWENGARCFPGSCTGNVILNTDCKCARGFTNTNCATATVGPTIKEMHFKVSTQTNDTHMLIVDKALGKVKFWTKYTNLANISYQISAYYKPEIEHAKKPNYIYSYYIGIAEVKVVLTLIRDSATADWTRDVSCTNFNQYCSGSLSDYMISNMHQWKTILNNGKFKHADIIRFRVSAKNGGKVMYQDRNSFNAPYQIRYYYLNGKSTYATLDLAFDEVPPTHCFEYNKTCSTDALKADDFVTKPNLTVYWSGWYDVDSGIDRFIFNIYYLESINNGPLQYRNMLPATIIDTKLNSAVLKLEEPGPYSIEMKVHDRVKNAKVTRRIIMYDNASVVELVGNKSCRIIQAQPSGWVNKFSDQIEIVWTGRFRNMRHNNGGWLNAVQDSENVPKILDDQNARSTRTIEEMPNVYGIIRFEIARTQEFFGTVDYKTFYRVPDDYLLLEKMVYTDLQLTDGKKVTYTIRGVDVFGEFAEDNISFMIDLSPPVIEHVWLRRGNLINISMHDMLDLSDLIIEWETFDIHSGISEVSWTIFENLTNHNVIYEQSYEQPQGETKTLSGCRRKYRFHSGGPNCYCTPYNGCFHKHFQIIPPKSRWLKDVILNTVVGKHDHDYFIEVTAKNYAGLVYVLQKRITIDISPPSEGYVYDGQNGDSEVDFQSTLQLTGHWSGFFDVESSVWFYTYGFSEHCLTEDELDIHAPRNWRVQWTYNKWAKFAAPRNGKYYLTVSAYNYAIGQSKPVCSNGVNIDSTPAEISEVVVEKAVVASGLLKDIDTEKVYFLNKNRELEEITGPHEACRYSKFEVCH